MEDFERSGIDIINPKLNFPDKEIDKLDDNTSVDRFDLHPG